MRGSNLPATISEVKSRWRRGIRETKASLRHIPGCDAPNIHLLAKVSIRAKVLSS